MEKITHYKKVILESVLKPAECRIGTDFSVGQGDLTRESWRISSQINAAPAEKGALRRRFDGFKTDSRAFPQHPFEKGEKSAPWRTLPLYRSSFSSTDTTMDPERTMALCSVS